jgi:hypothetical protein
MGAIRADAMLAGVCDTPSMMTDGVAAKCFLTAAAAD